LFDLSWTVDVDLRPLKVFDAVHGLDRRRGTTPSWPSSRRRTGSSATLFRDRDLADPSLLTDLGVTLDELIKTPSAGGLLAAATLDI
jgi:hypothetical protein